MVEPRDIDAAVRRAYALVRQLPVRSEDAVEPLATLAGTYDALARARVPHDAAVAIAAAGARKVIGRVHPHPVDISYPIDAGALGRGESWSAASLAGYCESIAKTARRRLESASASSCVIAIGECTHRFGQEPVVVHETPLVGLDTERSLLRKYVRQLFLYDPACSSNPDQSRFPSTILLSGPPGTGKSSLLGAMHAHASELVQLTKVPYRFETYDASRFSSYFGRSTRILKRLVERVSDTRGVGILAIEDADMVLASRDDTQAYHGVLELQQFLMNHLSGLRADKGNTLTVLTTNKPEKLDEALRSRIGRSFLIDPFVDVAAHTAFFRARAPHLPHKDCATLATRSFAAGLRGRDLASIIVDATESVTLEPTDAELCARARKQMIPAPSCAALLQAIERRV